ncbi:MAG: hypothetical protein ACRELV_05385 [Longimicrobiales bacterium]
MSLAPDVLRIVREEYDWLLEGPADPEGKSQIRYYKAEEWDSIGLDKLNTPDLVAVREDGQLNLRDQLKRCTAGTLDNPRHVVLRMVDPQTAVRQSIVMVRADLYPEDTDEFGEAAYL